ncbi:MAG: dual specificity protein phosphatase family protein [Bdellovibrionales bacterium]|nr:dual specificity protein phosphatase family protein [Bdellovibrionales bacterium]
MKNIIILLFASMLTACAHHHHAPHKEGAPKVVKGTFGDVDYYTRSNTYFMGQPTPAALDAAKADGVTTVINLRTPEEINSLKYKPSEEAKKRGLNYYNYPVNSKEPLDIATLDKIEKTFVLHHKKGEKVIVHCTSGQRAATWFAYHLRNAHGENLQKALSEARDVGLTNEKLIEGIKSLEPTK